MLESSALLAGLGRLQEVEKCLGLGLVVAWKHPASSTCMLYIT